MLPDIVFQITQTRFVVVNKRLRVFCIRKADNIKGDPLDFAAGITLHKKRGDYVHKGESLATFYGAADKFEAAAAEYRSGLVYGAEKPEEAPLVYALVTKDGVERY